jgi:tetratricopeptide (TPR) repeat protein
MSRTSDRALLVLVLSLVAMTLGCDALDGRSRNKKGNRLFKETKFIDAVAQYEKALKTVDDPIIHYNLALAYSKVFAPGKADDPSTADKDEGLTMLDVQGSFVCSSVPGTKTLAKSVCVKPGDHHYDACDAKNVCASSFTCQQVTLCTLSNSEIADAAATHFGVWLKAHPDDAQTRAIMTQVWLDSSQYKKAIEYWEALLEKKPEAPEIMGSLAGINLKAGDWRKSIQWYQKVAEVTKDETAKAQAFASIGNVAWSKLNSKSLDTAETVELADYGIGALQRAAELQPKNPKHFGLMGSIFNFRSLAQGASWAAGLDRARAQDLQITSRVLSDEAKKAQGLSTTPAPAAPAPAAPKTEKTGG